MLLRFQNCNCAWTVSLRCSCPLRLRASLKKIRIQGGVMNEHHLPTVFQCSASRILRLLSCYEHQHLRPCNFPRPLGFDLWASRARERERESELRKGLNNCSPDHFGGPNPKKVLYMRFHSLLEGQTQDGVKRVSPEPCGSPNLKMASKRHLPSLLGAQLPKMC